MTCERRKRKAAADNAREASASSSGTMRPVSRVALGSTCMSIFQNQVFLEDAELAVGPCRINRFGEALPQMFLENLIVSEMGPVTSTIPAPCS